MLEIIEMNDRFSILEKIAYPIAIATMDNGNIIFCNAKFKEEFSRKNEDTTSINKLWAIENENSDFASFITAPCVSRPRMVFLTNKYLIPMAYFVEASSTAENEITLSIWDASYYLSQQRKLENLNQKYLELLDITNTGYAILDDNLVIQECNSILTRSLGFDDNALVGENISTLLSYNNPNQKDGLVCDLLLSIKQKSNNIHEFDVNLKTASGESKWAFMKTNNFGENKIACLFHDITQKKNAEQRKFINGQKHKDKMMQNLSRIRKSIDTISGNSNKVTI